MCRACYLPEQYVRRLLPGMVRTGGTVNSGKYPAALASAEGAAQTRRMSHAILRRLSMTTHTTTNGHRVIIDYKETSVGTRLDGVGGRRVRSRRGRRNHHQSTTHEGKRRSASYSKKAQRAKIKRRNKEKHGTGILRRGGGGYSSARSKSGAVLGSERTPSHVLN